MSNPERKKFLPLLSPYVDGELSPEERREVDAHLATDPDSAKQVADFRAGDGLMRASLELQADQIDWKDFSNDVLAKVKPGKLPLMERLSLTFWETFTYQRGPMIGGLVGVAATLAIGIPLALTMGVRPPAGYENPRVEVQMVEVEKDAATRPVVMETEGGDAVIWMVENNDPKDGGKKKKGGEEGEEEVVPSAPTKEGDL